MRVDDHICTVRICKHQGGIEMRVDDHICTVRICKHQGGIEMRVEDHICTVRICKHQGGIEMRVEDHTCTVRICKHQGGIETRVDYSKTFVATKMQVYIISSVEIQLFIGSNCWTLYQIVVPLAHHEFNRTSSRK